VTEAITGSLLPYLPAYKPTCPFPEPSIKPELAAPLSSLAGDNDRWIGHNDEPAAISQRISFDLYDNTGNLLQQHKVSDGNISYRWDYNLAYPIA